MERFKVKLRETYEREVVVEATTAEDARWLVSSSSEGLVPDDFKPIRQEFVSVVPAVAPKKAYTIAPDQKRRLGHGKSRP
jgi:hypothetical protein